MAPVALAVFHTTLTREAEAMIANTTVRIASGSRLHTLRGRSLREKSRPNFLEVWRH